MFGYVLLTTRRLKWQKRCLDGGVRKIVTEIGNRCYNVCSNEFKTPQMSQNHMNSKNYISSFERRQKSEVAKLLVGTHTNC